MNNSERLKNAGWGKTPSGTMWMHRTLPGSYFRMERVLALLNATEARIARAVAEERERCAKILDRSSDSFLEPRPGEESVRLSYIGSVLGELSSEIRKEPEA